MLCPKTRGIVLRALVVSRCISRRRCFLPGLGRLRGGEDGWNGHFMAASATAGNVILGMTLEDLQIENTFVSELPGDTEEMNVPRQVFGALWSPVEPTPVSTAPSMVAYSKDVCKLLSLDPSECERPEFPLIFSGCAPLPKGQPYAQCYGGHQFGNWAGQLGDGRAISLGEVATSNGRWELQLKGAGKTPYSRFADGRAVLRSSIREYVASEALHNLGVPTTRALSIVATNDEVPRDMFYNGDVKMEPGAVVCRVSPSFVRFGTFQLPVSRGNEEGKLSQALVEYVLKHHYPHLAGEEDASIRMLEEVVQRSAELVVKWQLIGFVHGVLNTDNMSILGLTIDYGPYGFLDKFDPTWTPNLTDAQGRRYCYKNQIQVVQWNLAQLGSALLAADLCTQEQAQAAIDAYGPEVLRLHNDGIRQKLGLPEFDEDLAGTFFKLMYEGEADFTNSFRALTGISHENEFTEVPSEVVEALGKVLTATQAEEWVTWLNQWRESMQAAGWADATRRDIQQKVNPVYVPRQHLLQKAIDAATDGDHSELEALMQVLQQPYTVQEGMERFASKPPADMVRPGISMLSCSS